MLVLTIPGLYLVFHHKPPESEEGKPIVGTTAPPSKSAGNRVTFFAVCVVLLASGIGIQFALNLSVYAQNIGYSLAIGATMTTMVCGKQIFIWVSV